MPRKLTTEEWIERAKSVHGDKYDYSKVEYKNSSEKVYIICREHGEFWQNPSNHCLSHECPKCKNCFRLTNEYFIEKSIKIHGNKYEYTKINIGKNNKEKVIITCPIHGDFLQRPNDHLTGYGCRKCAEGTLSVEQFIEEATTIHNGKYDYSKVQYEHMLDKVTMICPEHGEFIQQPFYHLRKKHGCRLCSNLVSKRETIWLDSLGISHENRQVEILNGKYKADGYDPETNTVYEFYGDYWHGNPKKFRKDDVNMQALKSYGELYDKTMQREKEIKSHGYKVVAVWESELY